MYHNDRTLKIRNRIILMLSINWNFQSSIQFQNKLWKIKIHTFKKGCRIPIASKIKVKVHFFLKQCCFTNFMKTRYFTYWQLKKGCQPIVLFSCFSIYAFPWMCQIWSFILIRSMLKLDVENSGNGDKIRMNLT